MDKLFLMFFLTLKNIIIQGGGDEAVHGRRVRGGRQPNLLQPQHGHVARRRQEDVRRPLGASQASRSLRVETLNTLLTIDGSLKVSISQK